MHIYIYSVVVIIEAVCLGTPQMPCRCENVDYCTTDSAHTVTLFTTRYAPLRLIYTKSSAETWSSLKSTYHHLAKMVNQLAEAVAGAVGGGAVAYAAMLYLSRKNPALVLTSLERNILSKVLYIVSFTL